jgi:hypothetical protein
MTVENTLAERGSRYGEFADHAKIAQGLQDVMRSAPKWQYLDQDMKQALSVIADKIARILNGDPYYQDNWHDIIGYSTLIENRLKLLDTQKENADPFANNVKISIKDGDSIADIVRTMAAVNHTTRNGI